MRVIRHIDKAHKPCRKKDSRKEFETFHFSSLC